MQKHHPCPSEKAELWHNLLELSGIRGNDYYIWLGCQREVQGLFNSCDLKLPRGLGTFSLIAFSCHEGQVIGQNGPLDDMEKILCLKRQCGFIFTSRAYYSSCFQTALGDLGLTEKEISKSDLIVKVAKQRSHDWYAWGLLSKQQFNTSARDCEMRYHEREKSRIHTWTDVKRVLFAFSLVT